MSVSKRTYNELLKKKCAFQEGHERFDGLHVHFPVSNVDDKFSKRCAGYDCRSKESRDELGAVIIVPEKAT